MVLKYRIPQKTGFIGQLNGYQLAVYMKNTTLWNEAPCSLVVVYYSEKLMASVFRVEV
jgi:hypothetical protein